MDKLMERMARVENHSIRAHGKKPAFQSTSAAGGDDQRTREPHQRNEEQIALFNRFNYSNPKTREPLIY